MSKTKRVKRKVDYAAMIGREIYFNLAGCTRPPIDLTPGKRYKAIAGGKEDEGCLLIKDDTGYKLLCILNSCLHLNGGSWRVVGGRPYLKS